MRLVLSSVMRVSLLELSCFALVEHADDFNDVCVSILEQPLQRLYIDG